MLHPRNGPSAPTHCKQILWIVLVFLWLELGLTRRPTQAERLIGYTELHTNLPGGRHANVRTRRAAVMRLDGTDRRLVAPQLVDKPDAWTQFAGWSPDGQQAVIYRGWQDPRQRAVGTRTPAFPHAPWEVGTGCVPGRSRNRADIPRYRGGTGQPLQRRFVFHAQWKTAGVHAADQRPFNSLCNGPGRSQ